MKNKSKEYELLLLYDILAASDCLCSILLLLQLGNIKILTSCWPATSEAGKKDLVVWGIDAFKKINYLRKDTHVFYFLVQLLLVFILSWDACFNSKEQTHGPIMLVTFGIYCSKCFVTHCISEKAIKVGICKVSKMPSITDTWLAE